MPSRLFQFEKKIGWGELIGFVALLFAGLSLYFQIITNKADISLINDQLIAGDFEDSDGLRKHFGLYRAFISNNGNKAVTLIGLKPHNASGLIVTTEKGSTDIHKDKISYKISFLSD